MPLGMEVNLGPGDVVLDGVAAPPPEGHSPAVFSPCLCGQTAGLMKTPLGTEVDLGPGHVVLDRDLLLVCKASVFLLYVNNSHRCFLNKLANCAA